jgi:hypothetical protein
VPAGSRSRSMSVPGSTHPVCRGMQGVDLDSGGYPVVGSIEERLSS